MPWVWVAQYSSLVAAVYCGCVSVVVCAVPASSPMLRTRDFDRFTLLCRSRFNFSKTPLLWEEI